MKTTVGKKEKILSPNLFPVVGVGASAGGLDAFKKLIKAIPQDSGMAFVLVQHLDPNHESLLTDLLQKVTPIPVLEISDDIRVEPNHIYIIPSNKMLIANDGVLELSPRPSKSKREKNLPIDLFFKSLAEVHQSHAIGVVLSGTASDGTAGLKIIKEHGGLTFAQDEESAAYSGMPGSAVLAGVVDFILPPDQIPLKILEVHKSAQGADGQTVRLQDEDMFQQILSMLRIRKGTDFSYYKQTTIRRRILRRMSLNRNELPEDYLHFLRANKQEQDILHQDLLIPVTGFFRDPKSFDTLCRAVLPQIMNDKDVGEPIRVWVTACSTGEEAYSIAMCFSELFGKGQKKIQIFATDISEPAIAKARAGIYTNYEVSGVSDAQLAEFFTPTSEAYLINKSLREMCVFAEHNFLKDPPFRRMDLISCRNVLIYMQPYLQKKALTIFHYALNVKGFLFLGRTETANCVNDLFTITQKTEKLYTRNDVPVKYNHTANPKEGSLRTNRGTFKTEALGKDFQRAAEDIMLSQYTPAAVIVNETMEIVHFSGNTSVYLAQLPGKPSHNLIKMARHGLGFELRSLLHKAKKEHTQVLKTNISLQINESISVISIEVIPLSNTIEPYYLVLFHDGHSVNTYPLSAERKNSAKNKKGLEKGKERPDPRDIRILQLERELAQTHEDMRSITDDQEAVNEELQSDNEELSSSSEELQSLNEELETSKEELQSSNEELLVVNQEMVSLNEQLKASRDYAETIVATTREPLLVLDKQLRVKTANRSFYETFRMSQRETEGKLIYDLGDKQWNIASLHHTLEKVLLENKSFFDLEVTTHEFDNIGPRTLLLNAREMAGDNGTESLILLSMEDITERKLNHEKERELFERFQNTVEQTPVAIMQLNGLDYIVEVANATYLQMVEKGNDFIGKPIFQSLPELATQGIRQMLDHVMQSGKPYYGNEVELLIFRDKKRQKGFYNFVYHPLREQHTTAITGIIVVATEVTEQVLSRKKVEESESRLRNLVEKAPSPICIFKGEEMVLVVANEPVFKTWNVGKEALGKPFLEIIPEMKDQPFMGWLLDVFHTGTTHYGNEEPAYFTLANQEKKITYFNFVYQPYREDDGTISGVMVLATDVTEQVLARKKIEESEAHFRLMADLMPAKISNANRNGDVIYFSKGWLDFTGMTFEELRNFGYHKIMHPDEIDEFQQRFQKASETRSIVEMEMRFVNKDGEYIWHLNRASPVLDEKGNIKMWVGVTTDISEQIKTRKVNLENYEMHSMELEGQVKQRTIELSSANESLEKKNQELQVKNHELNSFTYISSHDLQEPLRKIQTFTKLLLEKENQNLSDKGKDYYKRVDDAARRMQRLIEDLLSFSRIGSSEGTFEHVELNKIIEEVKSELNETIEEKKATIEIKELCSVYIIPFQFPQLMVNLVGNALKFSKAETPPHIIIESVNIVTSKINPQHLIPGKEYCHISVKDNGIGFDPEYKDKVFDLFQRLHAKEAYPGTGIGLSIVKKIVENHNGHIFATSTLNEGATFDIYIPLEQAGINQAENSPIPALETE